MTDFILGLYSVGNLRLLALVFALMFVGTLVLVPWLLVRIPADYFHPDSRRKPLWAGQHPLLRLLLLVGKNFLGMVVLLMGMAMLVLPGQGLLTILIGLLLLDFPGKYRAERWLVQHKPVLQGINWLREKAGRKPLET